MKAKLSNIPPWLILLGTVYVAAVLGTTVGIITHYVHNQSIPKVNEPYCELPNRK